MIVVLRIVYCTAALVGLIATSIAYARARWVYRSLVDAKINGQRQLLAAFFVEEDLIRVVVQVLLLGIALITIYLNAPVINPPLMAVAVLAHIVVVVLLAAKAVLANHHRTVMLNSMMEHNGAEPGTPQVVC